MFAKSSMTGRIGMRNEEIRWYFQSSDELNSSLLARIAHFKEFNHFLSLFLTVALVTRLSTVWIWILSDFEK